MTMMSDLLQDLVEEILYRVPITSLRAVRSTCKRWNTLSKDRILCKAEARHQFIGFMMKKYKLCSMRFDLHGTFNEEGGDEFVDPSIKELGNLFNQVKISRVFQCDGLLLCVTKEDNTRLVVWNPYLDQMRWIQPINTYHRFDRYAIGYDTNGKHKILRFLDDREIDRTHVFAYEIYDFSSNSWRVLDITPGWEIESYQRGASLKGNTYFIAKEKQVFEEDGEYPEPPDYLLCFDFTTESFGQFLPLPFQHFFYDAGALSSLRDEKLAALFQSEDRSEVEIWVTTMIETNTVSWNPFLKVDMEPHYGLSFMFNYAGGSFFIDEEKKVAVVIHFDASETTRYKDAAYIIGENGYVKKVPLGGSLNFSQYCCPLVCCSSYVPSLVQINQTAAGFKKESDEEEANLQAQIRRLTVN
ncbi:F-box domain [Arabidopsis suecica]|uniref:F-box domain n=1 Tax=Arabidopsis suecica TaxID=45249 RepID=A0A8T1ZVU6_ARASU|nr:F-box domain [Arabidopsis suecica]